MELRDLFAALQEGRLSEADARAQAVELLVESLRTDPQLRQATERDLVRVAQSISRSVFGLPGQRPTTGARPQPAAKEPPCSGGEVVDQRYSRECIHGWWHHVVTETYRCPDGTTASTRIETPTGQRCVETPAGEPGGEAAPVVPPPTEPTAPPSEPAQEPLEEPGEEPSEELGPTLGTDEIAVAMRAPCEGGEVVDSKYTRECIDGWWYHVVTETFRCPDGTTQPIRSLVPTGQRCAESGAEPAPAEPERPSTVGEPVSYGEPPPTARRRDEPPYDEEDGPPTIYGEEISADARKWAVVNVKVVCWIPFHAGNEILRGPSGAKHFWYPAMDPHTEQLVKEMLSTGNPTPPATFPTRAAYDAFVQSNEYRAILDSDLLICCDAEGKVVAVKKRDRHRVGYTPAGAGETPGDGSADAIRKYHQAHESTGSKLRRAKARPPLSPNAQPPFADPESFTPGNSRTSQRGPSIIGDCGAYWPKVSFQVNDDENLGFGIVSGGYILPYMWVELPPIKLCCPGTVTVSGIGSSIPSKALYINNSRLDTFDMMAAPYGRIYDAMFAVSLRSNPRLALNPKDAPDAPQMPGIQVRGQRTVDLHDGCPDDIPDDWLFDGGGWF